MMLTRTAEIAVAKQHGCALQPHCLMMEIPVKNAFVSQEVSI